ncbi:hypothetical protein JCM11251_006879 [Rhodosporidiobolus azoricus]
MSSHSLLLERTSSAPRRPSLPRPTLPSLASWTTSSSYTSNRTTASHPPASAGSNSSIEPDEAVTPGDGPFFPPPPTHLKMPSPKPSHENGFSPVVKAPLAGFRVQDIPPFRGAGGSSQTPHPSAAGSTSSLSSSAGASILPSGVPTSMPPAHPEVGYRRASTASVFSLPRPNPPSASTSAAPARPPSQPAPVPMGLGIAGVGVGQSGQREALVIERLGEPNSHGRRGSLKRVLVSEDDEDSDVLRASLGSRDSDRSRMDVSDSNIPLPLQQAPAPAHTHSRREGSPLNPSSAAGRRAGSSSPPQPGTYIRRPSTTTGRDSPTASKRARTALSPLESLAATATNLLAAPSVASSTSSTGSAPPPPSAPRPSSSNGVSNVLSSFMLGQPSAPPSDREQADAYEATQRLREQYERRRAAEPPAPGSLGAALGKLRATAEAEGVHGSERASGGTGSGSSRSKSAIPVAPGEVGNGLGKRRGHRPPAVNTAGAAPASSAPSSSARAHPYPPPSATNSSNRVDDTLPPLRSATGLEIPSVLVGSPVDPSFAARAASELAPMRTAQMGPSRRQSRSGAVPGGEERGDAGREERPYPSVVQVQSQQQQSNQPPLVSSSTYYIRPNQPLGPGVAFPSGSSSTPSAASSSNKALPPAPPSAGPRLPSFGSATASSRASPPQPAFHPLHQQRPSSSGGLGSPLPPMRGGPPPPPLSSASLVSPAQYASVPPPSASATSLHHLPPQSAPVPPTSAAPTSLPTGVSSLTPPSSKTAFLSLFSTFYDSLSDSRVLSSSLETQISRASQLLHTLQHAETVLERMVDERVGRIERANEERWRGVEGRLFALERSLRATAGEGWPPSSSSGMRSGSLAPVEEEEQQRRRARTPLDERRGSGESAETAATSASGVEERLDRIEKVLADAAVSGSRPSSAAGRSRAGEGDKGDKVVEGREEEMPAQQQQ